jgi:hypothetical protein
MYLLGPCGKPIKRGWESEGNAYTMRIRISFSLRLIFLMMLRRPILEGAGGPGDEPRGKEDKSEAERVLNSSAQWSQSLLVMALRSLSASLP